MSNHKGSTRHDDLTPLIKMSTPVDAVTLNRKIDSHRPIKWAVWGPGTISHKFQRGMTAVSDGVLHAVGSRTLAHAEAWANQYDVPKAYGSIEALAADEEIDIVYVASPMSAHVGDCRTLLEHGRSVLCEKSVTINLDELVELLTLAKVRGCFFMEAMWSVFTPSYREALRLMHEGAIGDVKFLRASFNCGNKEEPEKRHYKLELGGGALLDLGIYPLAAVLTFLGDNVTKLQSKAFIGQTGVDYDHDILLELGDQYAYIASGFSQPEPLVFNLVGTKGRIVLGDPFICTETVQVIGRDGEIHDERHLPLDANGYEYEIRACHDALHNGHLWSPHWSWQHSVTAMAIMDSCRRQWGMLYPQETPSNLGDYLSYPKY